MSPCQLKEKGVHRARLRGAVFGFPTRGKKEKKKSDMNSNKNFLKIIIIATVY